MSENKPRLAIVGTGWAGFYVAQYINTNKYAVTIISPRRTSAYTPLLASAACGQFNFYLAEEPVRAKSRSAQKFIKANVLDIDFTSKSLHCAPAFDDDPQLSQQEFDVEYDILVLAPGCIPNTFNTPGVPEHALFMKNVSDAMAVRKLFFDLLEKASLPNTSPSQIRSLLHIAIVGGGPTGIELTAELDDLAKRELRDLYPEVADQIHISIYDVAPNILSAYDRKLYEYANESLTRRRVAIETNSTIERVDREAVYLKDRGRVGYGMLIWATGNRHIPLIEKLASQTRQPAKGLRRILTDNHLLILKPDDPNNDNNNNDDDDDDVYPSTFALGDAADIHQASLPTTAEVAVQKAKYLINHLNNHPSSANPPSQPFNYTSKSLISYLGAHDGVIEGKKATHDGGETKDGEGWTGRSAWLAWRSGSLFWTRSWRNRVMILLTWVINAVAGKEIARI
jgi:NADH:ubiquinone reductase (non-electrogenic)